MFISIFKILSIYTSSDSSSLSRDPPGYVCLVINTTLGYGITNGQNMRDYGINTLLWYSTKLEKAFVWVSWFVDIFLYLNNDLYNTG